MSNHKKEIQNRLDTFHAKGDQAKMHGLDKTLRAYQRNGMEAKVDAEISRLKQAVFGSNAETQREELEKTIIQRVKNTKMVNTALQNLEAIVNKPDSL